MAVKKVEEFSNDISTLENEIRLLEGLKHRNIVRYQGTEREGGCLCIFLEYVPGGSIKALIHKFSKLEDSVVRCYTRQILMGLEYLHNNGIAHRDIKGANCLVGNDGVIKLADFGASKPWRKEGTQKKELTGTPLWMAPVSLTLHSLFFSTLILFPSLLTIFLGGNSREESNIRLEEG